MNAKISNGTLLKLKMIIRSIEQLLVKWMFSIQLTNLTLVDQINLFGWPKLSLTKFKVSYGSVLVWLTLQHLKVNPKSNEKLSNIHHVFITHKF